MGANLRDIRVRLIGAESDTSITQSGSRHSEKLIGREFATIEVKVTPFYSAPARASLQFRAWQEAEHTLYWIEGLLVVSLLFSQAPL